MLDSKRNMVDQLKKKFNEFSKKSKKLTGEYKKIHPYLLELLGDYFTGVCEYRTFYLIDSNITVGWEGSGNRIGFGVPYHSEWRRTMGPQCDHTRRDRGFRICHDLSAGYHGGKGRERTASADGSG